MKPSATLWVIGSYHNIFRVGAILQDLGFWILNDVVWRKSNPMPNFRGRRFTNAHETLIWAARDAGRQGLYLQLRGAQGRQRGRAGALRLDRRALHRRGAAQGRQRQEAASDPEARGAAGAGDCSPPRGRTTSCSTRSAAPAPPPRWPSACGRRFIGIEREASYAAAARTRIAAVEPLAAPALASFMTAREAPRVPFAALIERGLVLAGRAPLRRASARSRRWCAPTAPSRSARPVGSIHRIGALAQGLEACNGWAFWHLETAKGLVSIDALRARDQGGDGAPVRSLTRPARPACSRRANRPSGSPP